MLSVPNTKIDSALANFVRQHSLESGLLEKAQEVRDTRMSRLTALEDSYTLVKEMALQNQARCQERISGVVTRCLDAVIPGNPYVFSMVFEDKRNQTEARCVLKDESGNEFDPISENGGGLVDLIAFGLRLACLMLIKPRPRKVLVLDEPFRFISANYRSGLTELLETLCEELDLQIIMVTHMPELSTQARIRL